jgi:hypothetical protein
MTEPAVTQLMRQPSRPHQRKEFFMLSIVKAIVARFKTLFVSQACLELEAALVASCAERKAELLRQAQRYEEEVLLGIAQHVRQQAEELSARRPNGSTPASIPHAQTDQSETQPDHQALPTLTKKGDEL